MQNRTLNVVTDNTQDHLDLSTVNFSFDLIAFLNRIYFFTDVKMSFLSWFLLFCTFYTIDDAQATSKILCYYDNRSYRREGNVNFLL